MGSKAHCMFGGSCFPLNCLQIFCSGQEESLRLGLACGTPPRHHKLSFQTKMAGLRLGALCRLRKLEFNDPVVFSLPLCLNLPPSIASDAGFPLHNDYTTAKAQTALTAGLTLF